MIDITTTVSRFAHEIPDCCLGVSALRIAGETYGILKTPAWARLCCPLFLKSSSTGRAMRLIPISHAAARALRNRSITCRNLLTYNLGADGYLELIRKARERVSIPVIASLNGVSPGGWAATPP